MTEQQIEIEHQDQTTGTREGRPVGDLIKFPRQNGTDGGIDIRDFMQANQAPEPQDQDDQADQDDEPTPVDDDDQDQDDVDETDDAASRWTVDWSHVWETARTDVRTAKVWSAAKWVEKAEERRETRAELKPLIRDAKKAAKRAHKADPEGKATATHKAHRELKQLRHTRPAPMWRLTTQWLIGIGVTGGVLVDHATLAAWEWTGTGLGAAAATNLGILIVRTKLHPRQPAPEPGIEPTEEEQRLLDRLQPEYWTEHADDRGLDGTITGRPELTDAGITAHVRLDGKWTPGKLSDAEGNIRALLGARTALRIEIKPGEHGGWATITLRTRLAGDGADMTWTPARSGIGLDTVTGRPVQVPLDCRLIVCGMSGSGKSWSSRSLMARAHLVGDLVYVDGKGEEATIWEKICRVAVEPNEIRAAVAEVHREMNRRKVEMKRRGISVWDGRQLTLYVDEGRVILALKDKKMIQQLIDVSALGRSRGVILWWATQYPTTSGDAPGIHPQIAANADVRVSLRVKNLTHAQVALDDDADYGPQLIRRDQRGHLYVSGHGPNLIRSWTMPDPLVRTLPTSVWHAAPAGPGEKNLTVVPDDDDETEVEYADPADTTASLDARVLGAVAQADEPVRQAHIVTATGAAQGSISKAVKRLIEAGTLVRRGDLIALADDADDDAASGA